jgi:hypothetical protein
LFVYLFSFYRTNTGHRPHSRLGCNKEQRHHHHDAREAQYQKREMSAIVPIPKVRLSLLPIYITLITLLDKTPLPVVATDKATRTQRQLHDKLATDFITPGSTRQSPGVTRKPRAQDHDNKQGMGTMALLPKKVRFISIILHLLLAKVQLCGRSPGPVETFTGIYI